MLSARQIVASVGDFQVGPVSFDLGPQEQLGIMGKSGSGKSTLLRMLSGFVSLTSGSISVLDDRPMPQPIQTITAGEQPADLPRFRRAVVWIAQHTWLWPHMSVYENVAFASRMLGLPDTEKRTDALLRALELDHLRDRRSWEVSGGEARRTIVARALAVRPRVLLCDEIETGLDPVRAQRLMELISNASQAQGTAVVIVTHNVATIQHNAQRVMIIDRGVVVESGPTATITASPQSDAGRELLNAWALRPQAAVATSTAHPGPLHIASTPDDDEPSTSQSQGARRHYGVE